MAAKKSSKTNEELRQSAPILAPEEWENHLIALSYQAVEQRILDGTATSAEYVHFLKAGSIKQREELEKLRKENELLKAKTSAIESERNRGEFYKQVIDALSSYRTESPDELDDAYVY
ncbi:MAG: hypothetical protein J6A79_00180 [Clostridia bacterium]|nr:hypothetical protein [Clostridia bacterium]